MTLRTMLGIGWSILCGLAGGWLVLMPWALNVQGGGDWTVVTKVSFGTGLGLLVFCLIGLIVTVLHVMRAVMPPRPAREAQQAQAQDQHADQESLDRALLQLATKLVADLEAPASGHGQPPAGPPTAAAVATAPGPSGAAPNGGATTTWRRVEQ